jgi:hypothetical protein
VFGFMFDTDGTSAVLIVCGTGGIGGAFGFVMITGDTSAVFVPA